eukprot:GHVL01010324.1.p1 GENE.GHVL01010324.1~~GHVL01010324.1.p1  ORF type:complete len:192 (+),score=20.29 GHVL01010324.1:34-609(+)
METTFAFRGKDFVLLAADSYENYSIIRLKNDEDKIFEVDGNKLLAASGPPGDRSQFCHFIQKNAHHHRLKTGIALSTKATASTTRNELARAIRKSPYQVNLMLGGVDNEGPQLFTLDYMGCCVSVPKGAHGYGAFFVSSILDRYWTPDMDLEEGIKIAKLCKEQMKQRFIISQSDFIVKIANKDGVRKVAL